MLETPPVWFDDFLITTSILLGNFRAMFDSKNPVMFPLNPLKYPLKIPFHSHFIEVPMKSRQMPRYHPFLPSMDFLKKKQDSRTCIMGKSMLSFSLRLPSGKTNSLLTGKWP